MFPNSVFITTFEMCHLSLHHKYNFKNAEPFEIDKEVVAITTSWPSGWDVSVIVKGTTLGTVAIVGEMFHSEEDLEDDELWRARSWDHKLQKTHWDLILTMADYIVPVVSEFLIWSENTMIIFWFSLFYACRKNLCMHYLWVVSS